MPSLPPAATTGATALIILLLLVGLPLAVFFLSYGTIYVRALLAGAHVSIFNIIGMRLRGVPPSVILKARITAGRAGLDVETRALETHYLAGGDVSAVVESMIAARDRNMELTFNQACAIDLEGEDVVEAVRRCESAEELDRAAPNQTDSRAASGG